MQSNSSSTNRRILIVDDSPTIHHDFRTILAPPPSDNSLESAEAELFGEGGSGAADVVYEVDSAHQGDEGVRRVVQSLAENRPYALAFVDVRMPPGIDGIETTEQLFKADARVHVVICTAYSDHSWKKIIDRLGVTDRLLILKKPFDSIEVRQLALAMTTKWQNQLIADQKRDEMQQWLDELNALVAGTQVDGAVTTPLPAPARA